MLRKDVDRRTGDFVLPATPVLGQRASNERGLPADECVFSTRCDVRSGSQWIQRQEKDTCHTFLGAKGRVEGGFGTAFCLIAVRGGCVFCTRSHPRGTRLAVSTSGFEAGGFRQTSPSRVCLYALNRTTVATGLMSAKASRPMGWSCRRSRLRRKLTALLFPRYAWRKPTAVLWMDPR